MGMNEANLTLRQRRTLAEHRPALELRMMLYGDAKFTFINDDTDIHFEVQRNIKINPRSLAEAMQPKPQPANELSIVK